MEDVLTSSRSSAGEAQRRYASTLCQSRPWPPCSPVRRKPLRTYSKKRPHSAIEPRGSLADKRRRTSPSPELPELPAVKDVPRPPVPPSTSSFEKGSILNYFKPSRSSSSADSSSDVKKISSPPTSPIILKTRRTPRRLRLRPSTPLIAAFDEDLEEEQDQYNGERERAPAPRKLGVKSDPITGDDNLKDVPASKLNEQPTISSLLGDPGTQPKKPTRSKSTPVQTTINLSTKPAFEECKLCHIVYNPLHPKDVKYHAKRHKAIMRSLSGE